MWQYYSGGRPRDVPQDPFTIGATILGFVGAGGLASTPLILGLTLGGAIGSIALGGLALGANYALAAINKPKGGGIGDAATINSPEARGSVQQSSPIKRWIYGRSRVGGAVSFFDDSKPPYLYLQLLLSDRRVSGVRGLHISTNDIMLSSFAFDTILTPLPVEGQIYVKSGVSRLHMDFGAGLDDQGISPLLASDFPNLESSFRQRCIARANFRFDFGDSAEEFEAMWGQGVSVPNPLIDVDGMPLYDPRDPSQRYPLDWRDAEDVADAMSSWKYIHNGREVGRTAALAQADWLGHPDGVNYPPGRIRWDEIGRAAEFDEERGHQIDGMVTLDQSPRTALEAMLTANRGFCVQDRGFGWIGSSQPREPVTTIDDDMLLGGFEFQCDRAKADLVNQEASRFSAADREYQDVDGPVVTRDDLIEEDDELIPRTLRLPFTSDSDMVQILSNQYIDEARLKKSLNCNIKIKAIGDAIGAGRAVRVDSRLYPQMNGRYAVETMGFLDDFSGLSLGLREYDPTIAVRNYPLQPFELPDLDVS